MNSEEFFALEYCEPDSKSTKDHLPIATPARLLFDHPFSDRKWFVCRQMEPQWFLLCMTEGQVLAVHESQFSFIQ